MWLSFGALVGKPIGSKKGDVRERPHLPELRLRHAIPYALAGQFAYVLTQMGVLSALAHFRGAEAVGEFGLALALTTPAFMFVNMGSKTSLASDIAGRYSFAEYASVALSAAAFGVAASIAAGILFAPASGVLLILIIVALTKAVESVCAVAYGVFQQAGRADKVAISLTLRGVLTLSLFVLLLALGTPVAFAFLAQLLVWSVLAFTRDYPLASHLSEGRLVWPSTDRRRILRLARETAPLGASHVVGSLLVTLPRMFVERSLGLSAVGLLTVVTYFQQAGSMLFGAMSQVVVNRFARLQQRSSKKGLRKTIKALLVFATIFSAAGFIAAIVAGEWVLRLLFGEQFAAAHGLLVLVALALCAKLYGMIPQSLLHAERRYKTFFVREIAAVAACVVFLAICVPRWGLMGAGYAIVAAAIARLLMIWAAVLLRRPRDTHQLKTTTAKVEASS